MPARKKLDFPRMVRDFLNTSLPYSQRIRERSDAIARLIVTLVGSDGPPPPPEAPDGLSANGLEKSVTLDWAASEGASTYRIYRSDTLLGTFVQINETSELRLLDVGLEDETTYFYYVTAVSVNLQESEPSEVAEATTLADTGPGAPTTPTGLAGTSVDPFVVELTWDALAADTVAVAIERRRPGASVPEWVPVVSGSTGTAYSDDRVSPNVEYEYRIAGLNVAGDQSAFSAAVPVTSGSSDETPPSVPENLTLTPGVTTITAEWDPSPEPDTEGYILGISQTSGVYSNYTPLQTNPSVVVPNLTPDTPYFCIVKAVDFAGNESAFSPEVSVSTLPDVVGDTTPPPPVTEIGSGSQAEGEITVVWTEVSATDLDGYIIEVSLPPNGSPQGSFVTAATAPAGTSEWTFTGLELQSAYSYRVRSVDTTGNQAAPSPVTTRAADGAQGPPGVTNIVVNQAPGTPQEPGGGPVMPGDEEDPNDPIAGITTDGTEGSTVLGYHFLSLDEKKALFLPGMRGNRADRPFDRFSEQWFHGTCPSFKDSDFLHSQGANICYGSGRPPVNSPNPITERTDNEALVMENCEFTRFENTTSNAPKWALQDYAQPAHITLKCDFESAKTGPVGSYKISDNNYYEPQGDELVERYPRRIEHCRYHHTARSVIWKDTTSKFCGGHTCYVANRPFAHTQYAPDNPIPNRQGIIWVDNCHLLDSNINASKGSNCIEVFDYGSPTFRSYAVIRNSTIIDNYEFWYRPYLGNALHYDLSSGHAPDRYRAKGLINFSGYQYCENPQQANPGTYEEYNSPGGFGAGPTTTKAVLIKNCILGVNYPLRNVCGFGGVEDVIFEDCTISVEPPSAWRGIVVNENGYLASDAPGFGHGTRGLPRVQTISFANCRTTNLKVIFKRLDGQNDFTQVVPENLVGQKITYDCSDGSIVGGAPVAYDPVADATDVAAWINEVDPFAGISGVPAGFDWGVPGVTV